MSEHTPSSTGQLDSVEDVKREDENPKRAEVRLWVKELEHANKYFEQYHKRVDAIVLRYRDERKAGDDTGDKAGDTPQRRYNALWSMKETLKPLLFSETPRPYVSRMHDDDDPAGRDAALILQRALAVKSQTDTFYDALDESVDGYTLAGRGMTWVTYSPTFAVRESDIKTRVSSEGEAPADPFSDDETPYKVETDDEGLYYKEKFEYTSNETCIVESVGSKDLLHGAATKWRHVPWVARRVPMLRTELVKRFGKKLGEKIPLTAKEVADPRHSAANTDDFKGQFRRAIVWEIWDRVRKQVVWICPDYLDSVLDKKSDMLKLESFFPTPKPMYGTKTDDSLLPIPDYTQWQDIALELDDVTFRISLLISALRVAGVYSDEYGSEISLLLKNTGKNEMIAVKNWSMFAEKGGLKGAVDFVPLDQVIQTLDKLYQVRTQLVQELYEITGISDIVRGASDPRETAAAQKLKGQFANARLTSRQRMVARHAREILNILAEIICSHYSDDTIKQISGAEQLLRTPDGIFDEARWMNALALLRDEPMRMLRVNIDTETLAVDTMQQDRQEATEFVSSLTQLIQGTVPMLQQAPAFANVFLKVVLFSVRKFKVGRNMEAELESALRALMSGGMGAPQEQGGEGKSDAGMNALEHQIETQRLELDKAKLEIDRMKLDLERQKLGLQGQKQGDEKQIKHRDLDIKEFKATHDVQLKGAQIAVQRDSAAQQAQQAANDSQMTHNREVAGMQMDAQRADRDAQLRTQEFSAGREDEAARFSAEREDRAEDRRVSAEGAAEDRKIKAGALKAKTSQRPTA